MSKTVDRWIPILMLLALVLLPACGLKRVLRQATPTPAPPEEVQVTADQAAQAMQDDAFYADYRGDRLLVTGKVQALNQKNGGVQLELETSLPTKVVCDLGAQTVTVQPGDQVTVQALAAEAERAPSAVLLKNCSIH